MHQAEHREGKAMKRFMGLAVVLVMTIGFGSLAHAAISISSAQVQDGAAVVDGKATKNSAISWEGSVVTTSKPSGSFSFSGPVPSDCVGALSDGVSAILVALGNCTPLVESGLLATGQTTAYQADKNDGVTGAVAVPDDGTLQVGVTLNYQDNGDGTVTDLNTGLMWEKNLAADGSGGGNCADASQANHDLRCVNNAYRWSGDGSQETIWDWLDDLNASNFAGHNDWRIPNVRELESIKDYQAFTPFAISPVFGPTQVIYWSSTTFVQTPSLAWNVGFALNLGVNTGDKTTARAVRAVRGGL
jgi:hypothetical protein